MLGMDGATLFRQPLGVAFNRHRDDQYAGTGAVGAVSNAAGEFINGQVYLYHGERAIASRPLSSVTYSLGSIPPSVIEGAADENAGAGYRVVIETESGGVASHEFDGPRTRYTALFSSLSVEVTDADGNPAVGNTVQIGLQYTTTDEDGMVEVETAGTKEVSALGGSLTKTIDVVPGEDNLVAFQYAGLDGSVQTPDGSVIAGKTVTLLTMSGDAIGTTETNENGEFSFVRLPVTTSMYVQVDPYFRKAATRGEGEYTVKNFPATSMSRGDPFGENSEAGDLESLRVELIDAVDDRPAEGVKMVADAFDVATDSEGVAKAFVEGSGSVEVSIGTGKRYRTRRLDVAADERDMGEIELERNVKSTQT